MEICEVWSIAPERIAAFFLSMDGVTAAGEGVYSFDGCTIRMAVLPNGAIGRYSIPRTRLCFTGRDEETRKIYRAFFVRFVSAGG